MKTQRLNTDYLNLGKEVPLFATMMVRGVFSTAPKQKTGEILIVNPCLIGEFAATVPAIYDFIERHPEQKIDLLVTPPLRPLAERVRGVRRVYTARSVYGRINEKDATDLIPQGTYEKTIVLRLSREAYAAVLACKHGKIKTGGLRFFRYGAHLVASLIMGKTPMRWSQVNFDVLGGTPRYISHKKIFDITEGDLDSLPPLHSAEKKKIIVHTHCHWPARRWSTEKWVQLLTKIKTQHDAEFIFVGGHAEVEQYDDIAGQLPFGVHSMIGKIDLYQLVLLSATADAFIGIDSGPRNVAHMVDLPSVTILGPGPHMYTPPNPRDKTMDKSNGRGLLQVFIHSKHPFIAKISVEEVYTAFKTLIQ